MLEEKSILVGHILTLPLPIPAAPLGWVPGLLVPQAGSIFYYLLPPTSGIVWPHDFGERVAAGLGSFVWF